MKAVRTVHADPNPSPGVPVRALVISLLALAVPVLAYLAVPGMPDQDYGMLVWLSALVPPFLLTYYRSWKGASVALAAGMAALSATHVALTLRETEPPSLPVLLVAISILIVVSLGAGWLSDTLHGARAQAESIARTDSLTGLANRRHLARFLEAAFGAAQEGVAVSVALFDLDGFKRVNDERGHAEGDRVLAAFGSLLAARTRDTNLSGRWGGEEFLAVLVGTDAQGAAQFAEHVRAELAERDFGWGTVTVSAGVAGYEPSMSTPDLLVAAADQLLYRAKEEGRNRVVARTGSAARRRASAPVGEGTTAPAADTRPDADDAPPPAGRGEVVLIVDDDHDARHSLGRVLARLGYRVLEADGPEQALAVVRDGDDPVDLVVTDVIMPTASGFRLVEMLQAVMGGVRVIYISGYSQEGVDWTGAPGHVRAFMGKPMSVDDLARTVRRVLDHPVEAGPGVVADQDAGRPPGRRHRSTAAEAPVSRPTRRGAGGVPAVPPELADARILAIHAHGDGLRELTLLLGRLGFGNVRGTADMDTVPVLLARFEPDLVLVGPGPGTGLPALLTSLDEPGTAVPRPVVAITEAGARDARRRALEGGASEVIEAPVDAWELEARLRTLLRLRNAQWNLAGRTREPGVTAGREASPEVGP